MGGVLNTFSGFFLLLIYPASCLRCLSFLHTLRFLAAIAPSFPLHLVPDRAAISESVRTRLECSRVTSTRSTAPLLEVRVRTQLPASRGRRKGSKDTRQLFLLVLSPFCYPRHLIPTSQTWPSPTPRVSSCCRYRSEWRSPLPKANQRALLQLSYRAPCSVNASPRA